MSRDSNASFWHVSPPICVARSAEVDVLLDAIGFGGLSETLGTERSRVSTHMETPRLPSHIQPTALEGLVVHLALQRITRALVERGCPSLVDQSAISTLRELGGFTAIILGGLETALLPYEGNPRSAPVLDVIRQRLVAQVPELRSRVQRFLSRIHPESRASRSKGPTSSPEGELRYQLQHGSYAELKLRASELGWLGVADLLTLSTTSCEIRDFKTGASKEEDEFQILTYALLWARDTDLNPSGRHVDRLVLSYDKGDIEVAAPNVRKLCSIEDELKERTAAALAALQTDPPEARPGLETCVYCAVRHLCEEYWQWHADQDADRESLKGQFVDLQIKLTGRHGPSSWDGVLESPSQLNACGLILLRTANSRFDFHVGQRLRLLNVHISMDDEEPMEDKCPPVVATMVASTEAFLLFT